MIEAGRLRVFYCLVFACWFASSSVANSLDAHFPAQRNGLLSIVFMLCS